MDSVQENMTPEFMERGQTFTEALNLANQEHRENGMAFDTYEDYASAPGSVDDNTVLGSVSGMPNHLEPSGPVSGTTSAASGPASGTIHVPVSVNVTGPVSGPVSGPVNGLVNGRPSAFKFRCGSCNTYYAKSCQLKQHLMASKAHPELCIQCRCGKSFSQYSLMQHIRKRLTPCNTTMDFRCHCGKIVKSNTPDAEKEILDHGYFCARQYEIAQDD